MCDARFLDDIRTEDTARFVLGLRAGCSLSDVKRAYKKLALSVHPDKNDSLDRAESSRQFQAITNAKDLLLAAFARGSAGGAAATQSSATAGAARPSSAPSGARGAGSRWRGGSAAGAQAPLPRALRAQWICSACFMQHFLAEKPCGPCMMLPNSATCFCGHALSAHSGPNFACEGGDCPCARFSFVPPNAQCTCGHVSTDHEAVPHHRCKADGCPCQTFHCVATCSCGHEISCHNTEFNYVPTNARASSVCSPFKQKQSRNAALSPGRLESAASSESDSSSSDGDRRRPSKPQQRTSLATPRAGSLAGAKRPSTAGAVRVAVPAAPAPGTPRAAARASLLAGMLPATASAAGSAAAAAAPGPGTPRSAGGTGASSSRTPRTPGSVRPKSAQAAVGVRQRYNAGRVQPAAPPEAARADTAEAVARDTAAAAAHAGSSASAAGCNDIADMYMAAARAMSKAAQASTPRAGSAQQRRSARGFAHSKTTGDVGSGAAGADADADVGMTTSPPTRPASARTSAKLRQFERLQRPTTPRGSYSAATAAASAQAHEQQPSSSPSASAAAASASASGGAKGVGSTAAPTSTRQAAAAVPARLLPRRLGAPCAWAREPPRSWRAEGGDRRSEGEKRGVLCALSCIVSTRDLAVRRIARWPTSRSNPKESCG
eukprot:TRINITY_DN13723_c0_g1_i2.p1 TRINITY_DN13723_c0_g1~~TRINITY_DN13723_c0_g1_i2.p1  ORF type:complete len:663 (-),score=119.32 TRINITY_DN13723_c0_g1_i2:619-2607(-)